MDSDNRLAIIWSTRDNVTCWLEEPLQGTNTPIKLKDQSYIIVVGESNMMSLEYCILCEHGFVWASIHDVRFLDV